jgi:methylphosphotriester-DNA--protein-cysteine methyltransferase
MAAHATVQEVLRAMEQMDFPAGKDDLLAAARAAGASEEVLKALRGVPPDEYATAKRSLARPNRTTAGRGSVIGHGYDRAEEQAKGVAKRCPPSPSDRFIPSTIP